HLLHSYRDNALSTWRCLTVARSHTNDLNLPTLSGRKLTTLSSALCPPWRPWRSRTRSASACSRAAFELSVRMPRLMTSSRRSRNAVNSDKKIKKNIHKTLSPTSVDKSVYRSTLPRELLHHWY